MQVPAPEVVAETSQWIAINKPSGLLTIPDRYLHHLPSARAWVEQRGHPTFVVHRIDKDTSGLLLFAKNAESHKYLSQLFEGRSIHKEYLGLVVGTPLHPSGTIQAGIAEHPAKNGTMVVHHKGKEAISHYQVEESFGKYALIRFTIETGRTHQVRVHARHLGHPIVADPFYGNGAGLFVSEIKAKYHLSKNQEAELPLMGRLALHAAKLSFTDEDGSTVALEAPLHKDFRAVLSQLRKYSKV